MSITAEEPFIVGADLNSSETFDVPRPSGNREIMDRMNALGYHVWLRMFNGKLTPTYRSPRGSVVHQLDHLYVTPTLLSKLAQCDVGSAERVFDARPMLSDHLPIVADLDCADIRAMGVAPVRVHGPDPYLLDGDNDGFGCE